MFNYRQYVNHQHKSPLYHMCMIFGYFFASLRFQSGAMCAIIGVVGCAFPDSRFSIAFLDQIYPHSFSAKSVSTNFHGNVYLKIESVLFKVSCWMEKDNYWSKIQICLICLIFNCLNKNIYTNIFLMNRVSLRC